MSLDLEKYKARHYTDLHKEFRAGCFGCDLMAEIESEMEDEWRTAEVAWVNKSWAATQARIKKEGFVDDVGVQIKKIAIAVVTFFVLLAGLIGLMVLASVVYGAQGGEPPPHVMTLQQRSVCWPKITYEPKKDITAWEVSEAFQLLFKFQGAWRGDKLEEEWKKVEPGVKRHFRAECL